VSHADNPKIARMYAGNHATEAGLKAILATICRYQQSERMSVRRYSADHIHHDAAGNEYRRY